MMVEGGRRHLVERKVSRRRTDGLRVEQFVFKEDAKKKRKTAGADKEILIFGVNCNNRPYKTHHTISFTQQKGVETKKR